MSRLRIAPVSDEDALSDSSSSSSNSRRDSETFMAAVFGETGPKGVAALEYPTRQR
ncbi:unnamed protein product, partial [Laminaria digitata]